VSARQPAAPLHTGAWLVWLLAAGVMLTVTRNPIYIGLVLLWVGIVLKGVAGEGQGMGASILSPLRFGIVVVPIAALFNALFVHAGETVLFRIPGAIPVVGGPVTLEALAYGALNGLVLTGLFAAFAVFNRVTPVRSLIQLAPRAYYPVAVTVAIAVTFVPVTLRQAMQIREAQAVRGHRLKGVRSWAPIFLPLLSSGMERALQLAEAMVARGFAAGGAEDARAGLRTQALLVTGTLLFGGGLVVRLLGQPLAGLALLLVGMALLVGTIWLAGRAHPHTVYRATSWQMADWAVAGAAAVAALLFLLPVPGIDRTSLAWYPYPAFTMPGFSLVLVAATWGLLGPAVKVMGNW
jgi:energy-coupling factor transport system permease protein